MRRQLARDYLEDRKVTNRWDPENKIKKQRAEKLGQHNLPVAHGGGHERLNCAELKFFCEQAHRDERENQNKGKPKEDRVKKCLLHRVLHLALVHERDLKIKINPANEEKKYQDDVGDRRIEIAANFAREQSIKLTHKIVRSTSALT